LDVDFRRFTQIKLKNQRFSPFICVLKYALCSIIATVAPILTVSFIGFLGGLVAGKPIPDYLVNVSVNERQVVIGMFIELIWALTVVGITNIKSYWYFNPVASHSNLT